MNFLIILYSLIFLLLSNAVSLKREKSILFSRTTILILIYTSLLCLIALLCNWLDKGIGLYNGLFYTSFLTHIFHNFLIIVSLTIIQLTGFYPRKIWKFSQKYKKTICDFISFVKNTFNNITEQFSMTEYSLMLLFAIVGGIFIITTNDLISMFLSIELQSYGLYLISAFYRNSELATSGGLTYFLLGSLSSCFVLFGASILYVNSGTTNLESLYLITNVSEFVLNNLITLFFSKSYIVNFCLLIMSVGFLFKVSAAPFHFWSPDVYDAVPTIVTTFIAITGKISILILILQFVYNTSKCFFLNYSWITSLLISSFLSLIIGTVVGLIQFRIKRLYAYSTISHIGFILLALCINSIESMQAFVFYVMQYSIANLNAFILLLSIGYSLYLFFYEKNKYNQLKDKKNSPIQLISQIKGYFYLNPIVAVSLAVTLFSFVGIPPLIGFFAKQMVLSAAIDNEYYFITLIAILTSVISAVYYLAVIKQIFFHKNEKKSLNYKILNIFKAKILTSFILKKTFLKNIILSSYLTFTISMLTLIIFLYLINPQEWWSFTNLVALEFF